MNWTVSIKTSAHVKIKRSWVYEAVPGADGREASVKTVEWACEWWGLKPRDITVVSVTEEQWSKPICPGVVCKCDDPAAFCPMHGRPPMPSSTKEKS